MGVCCLGVAFLGGGGLGPHLGCIEVRFALSLRFYRSLARPHMLLEPQRLFTARFELLIGGGLTTAEDPARLEGWERGYEPLAGLGLAFCFGALEVEPSSTAFGELGPALPHGLRVSLLTYTSRSLEVAYDGQRLATVILGSELRILSWAEMRIEYSSRGLDVW